MRSASVLVERVYSVLVARLRDRGNTIWQLCKPFAGLEVETTKAEAVDFGGLADDNHKAARIVARLDLRVAQRNVVHHAPSHKRNGNEAITTCRRDSFGVEPQRGRWMGHSFDHGLTHRAAVR